MQTFDPAEQTWLVVPLYNEAQVVAEVIANARKTFPNVVCVDDGSRDDSAAQARSAGAIVVSHPLNLGQGAALQTGITYVLTRTNARYIATFDSDGQHSTADVMAAWVGSKTSGMKLTDAHNGLRLLRRDAAEQLDLHQNRMAHASEIIRQLGASGLPWAEQPVHIEYTDYSRSKGQSLWNSVNILVDLMFS